MPPPPDNSTYAMFGPFIQSGKANQDLLKTLYKDIDLKKDKILLIKRAHEDDEYIYIELKKGKETPNEIGQLIQDKLRLESFSGEILYLPGLDENNKIIETNIAKRAYVGKGKDSCRYRYIDELTFPGDMKDHVGIMMNEDDVIKRTVAFEKQHPTAPSL